MDTLILEDFRCFSGRHEVPIRPLTLLVGENSTGKTSFLAAVRAAHDLQAGAVPDFNEDPFHLGSYDQIANYRGGSAKRARSFTVGLELTPPRRRLSGTRRLAPADPVRVQAEFARDGAQPAISHMSISSREHTVELEGGDGERATVSFSVADRVALTRDVSSPFLREQRSFFRDDIWLRLGSALHSPTESVAKAMTEADTQEFDTLLKSLWYSTDVRPYAFAPIRTSPRRTYDPTRESRDPEGSHTPMMLARLLENGADARFRGEIEEFGAESGLYSRVSIRKLGRTGSDPFQIEIKPAGGGKARNLIDVGYGVSQAIPIIADCLSAERNSTLLIQQPEVHLHPRAQAAMGSFFGQLAATERNRLVVETHSDYLVDRVRMDVRDEKIKSGDVMILYFEQGRTGVDIHPIELDAAGHVVDVPPNYRSFFMEEDRRFFGVDF